jgi:hypothetical protein
MEACKRKSGYDVVIFASNTAPNAIAPIVTEDTRQKHTVLYELYSVQSPLDDGRTA